MCPMKLVLLTHPASFVTASMPRFAEMILRGMTARGHAVEVWTSKPVLVRFPIASKAVRKWLGYVDQFLIYPRQLRKRAVCQPEDTLFVFTDQALGMWVPYLAHRPHVIHCHDFLALKSTLGEYPENSTGWTGSQYQRLILKGFSRGKAFISVSQKTKDDLARFLPGQPVISEVVHNGLNHPFRSMSPTERVSRLNAAGLKIPEQGFLLHVGGNQWYKNREGVIEIYRAYAESHTRPAALWMAGEPPTEFLRGLAQSIPRPGEVQFLNGLTNEQINAAYSHALAFLFPSLDEGFGWPIAEAMASQCPVITTGLPPMTEVACGAAKLIPRMPREKTERSDWAKLAAAAVDQVVRLEGVTRKNFLSEGRLNAARFNTDIALSSYEEIYFKALKLLSPKPAVLIRQSAEAGARL